MPRWFLSYHSPDHPLAERLKSELERKDAASSVFFAPSSLRAGGAWTAQLADELAKVDAFILLVGEKGVGKWQVPEYDEALDRWVKSGRTFPLIVVLLEGQTAPGLPYLHPLDELMAARDLSMVRYADDFVVLCDSMEKAQEALALILAFADENGLTLHPAKTHIGDCRIKGQGFEFLGYRFETGHRFVRKKSLLRLRDRIRAKTKRTSGQSLARTIAALNPTLKGWFGYFKHATSGLKDVDAFVRRRLRAMLRKQAKRHGCGAACNDRIRWPNAFFASAGLFTLETAWRQARQSR